MSAVPARRSSMAPAVTAGDRQAPAPAAARSAAAARATACRPSATGWSLRWGSSSPSWAARRSASTTSASARGSRAAPSMTCTSIATHACSTRSAWLRTGCVAASPRRSSRWGRSGRTGRSRRRGRWSGRSAPTAILGHLCVVAPLAAGRDALSLQRAAMDEIGRLLGEPPSVEPAADVVLAAALGGVWELLRRHLTEEASQGDLTAAAIYALLTPFVGRRRAVIRASALGHPRDVRRAVDAVGRRRPRTWGCWSPS